MRGHWRLLSASRAGGWVAWCATLLSAGQVLEARPKAVWRAIQFAIRPVRRGDRTSPGATVGRSRPVYKIAQCLRLLAENPFLIALPLARHRQCGPGVRALSVGRGAAALSVIATVVPPLRAFGPGRSYVKAAIFSTAYPLAYEIGTPAGLLRPFGLLVLLCLGLSVGAIVFFCVYLRRKPTEQSASTPGRAVESHARARQAARGRGLRTALQVCGLRCYWSGQPVVWGGHCGDQAGSNRSRPSSRVLFQKCSRSLACATCSWTIATHDRGRASSRARSADRQLRWLRGARVRGIRGRGQGLPIPSVVPSWFPGSSSRGWPR